MLFLTLESSYISLRVFLCQVKFMKKGISQETLADLCYCDTSSIYLVTPGRKDPYCAEKIPVTIVCQDFKGHWEVSWHCSGVTSDRSLLLWEFRRCCWEKPICAVQITGLKPQILGWDRFSCAYLYLQVFWLLTTKFNGCGAVEVQKSGSWISVHELSGVHDLILTVRAALGLIWAEKLWWYKLPL